MNKTNTGYVVSPTVPLHNLAAYGFYKSEDGPWWQRPFNVTWPAIGIYDCRLLVYENTRELFVDMDNGANTTELHDVAYRMLMDGILEKIKKGVIL